MNPPYPIALCAVSLLLAVPLHAQQPTPSVQVGHSDHVRAIAFTPDGTLVASGGQDNTVLVWDSESGLQLRALVGHAGAVDAVAFSPDGRLLASAGADRSIRLWDVASGRLLRTLTGHEKSVNAVIFQRDGRSLISASDDGSIRIWDVAAGSLIRTLSGHTREVYALSLSPDGRMLASGAYDRTLRIWDLARAQTTQTIAQRASSLAFSADGRTLISDGYRLVLWDVGSGRAVQTIKDYEMETAESRGAPVTLLAVARDGRIVEARGDSSLHTWDPRRQALEPLQNFSRDLPMAIAFSPDGATLAMGGYQNIVHLLSMPGGGQLRALAGHARRMHAVSFSPDGRLLVSGAFDADSDSSAKAWELASTAPPRNLPGQQGSAANLGFDSAGTQLVSGGFDNTVLVRDGHGERLLREIQSGPADRLSSSADGRVLATSGRDQSVHLWDPRSGRQVRQWAVDARFVRDIALSPDGSTLLTAGGERQLKLWDARSGTLRRNLQEDAESLAFSPDGRSAAFSGSDHAIRVFDPETGTARRFAAAHAGPVHRITYSPDGQLIASASADGTVRIWNVAGGQLQSTLTGHTNDVYGAAFSPDGRILASASWDATVKLWQVNGGALLATLLVVDKSDWLVITPDGLFDGSPGAWGRIMLRFSPALRDVTPVDSFFNEYFHPGLLAELMAGRRPVPPRDLQQVDRRQPQLRLGIDMIGPRDAPDMRRMKVIVRVQAAPAGARDVRLFRNGTLVRVWRGDVLQGRDSTELQTELTMVAGHNDLSAYAFNRDNVKSADATFPVIADPRLRRAGTTYVLAAGVNEYSNPQFNLRYAVADAEDFASALQGVTRQRAPDARVELTVLRNGEATKAALLKAIAALAAKVQPEDTVMIFFAGHGLAEDKRFYLVPHDMGYTGGRDQLDAVALRTVLAHGISDRELEVAVAGIDAAHLLLVIDACQSGQALDAAERRRGPMNSAGLAQLAYEKGMYVLTAAQSFQAAQELSELQHGLLTYALVEEGLKRHAADDAPRDGAVQLREWFDFAVQRVPQLQIDRMRAAAARGIKLAYAAGDEQVADPDRRNVQRPRAFYRREVEAAPLVIAGQAAAAR